MSDTATRIFHAATDTAQVVSTDSIKVHAIYVVNDSAQNKSFTFMDNNSTVLLRLHISNVVRTTSSEVQWYADNGLNVDAVSNGYVTVLYSEA